MGGGSQQPGKPSRMPAGASLWGLRDAIKRAVQHPVGSLSGRGRLEVVADEVIELVRTHATWPSDRRDACPMAARSASRAW